VAVGGEPAHVGAELGEDHLAGALGDAGDRAEVLSLVREGGQPLRDLVGQRRDRRVHVVQVGEDVRDDQRVVGLEIPSQRLPQRGQLRPQPTPGELGQNVRIAGVRQQRVEHLPSRDPEHV
jgi:hypothetical protein